MVAVVMSSKIVLSFYGNDLQRTHVPVASKVESVGVTNREMFLSSMLIVLVDSGEASSFPFSGGVSVHRPWQIS